MKNKSIAPIEVFDQNFVDKEYEKLKGENNRFFGDFLETTNQR